MNLHWEQLKVQVKSMCQQDSLFCIKQIRFESVKTGRTIGTRKCAHHDRSWEYALARIRFLNLESNEQNQNFDFIVLVVVSVQHSSG